jgi:hypothetical protein
MMAGAGRRFVLAGWVVAATALAAQAQGQGNWAEQMFVERSHDFGVVAKAAEVKYRFKVANIHKFQVHIAGARTSCGCASATPISATLQPGESAFVEVSMDTRRHQHKKNSNLIVTFDAPYYTEVYIPISAYIRTDVVLNPGAVGFGAVEQGKGAQQKVDIAYVGRSNWAIRDVRVNNEFIEAKIVENGRENGASGYSHVNYTLSVSLKPSAPPGELRDQIQLVTDDLNSPLVPVLVQARVESDVTVIPALVTLGMLFPGNKKTVNVVVRGRKPFAIDKIECESDSHAFSVRLPKDEKAVHVIPITITAPDAPGKISEIFTVTIAGRAAPVNFRASGQIAPAAANQIAPASTN